MLARRLFYLVSVLSLAACLAPNAQAYQDTGGFPRYGLTERQVARMGKSKYWHRAAKKIHRQSNDLALPHVNDINEDYATCRNHENQRLLRFLSPRKRRHACQIHTSLMDLADTWSDCDLANTGSGQVKGQAIDQAGAEIADLSAQIIEGMRKSGRKRYALTPSLQRSLKAADTLHRNALRVQLNGWSDDRRDLWRTGLLKQAGDLKRLRIALHFVSPHLQKEVADYLKDLVKEYQRFGS